MPGTPSRLRRLASFLARLFHVGPGSTHARPSPRHLEGLAELRARLTPEELTLLSLRLDQQLSWREVAEVLAGEGGTPREAEVRRRFEEIKERLGWMAEERGRARSATRAELEPLGWLAVAEVARLVGDPGARLLDVRPAEAFARGHLPGAVRVTLGDEALVLPADPAIHLVFYGEHSRDPSCHGPALEAALAGCRNVFIMPAGFEGWSEAGKRVELGE
jgi:rhodanese-related sulfurtransferase